MKKQCFLIILNTSELTCCFSVSTSVNTILGRNVRTRVEWLKEVALRVMASAVLVSFSKLFASGTATSPFLIFFFVSVSQACGSSTRENNVFLTQNSADTANSPCTYRICPCNNNICRIRYDFDVRFYFLLTFISLIIYQIFMNKFTCEIKWKMAFNTAYHCLAG